MARKIVLISSLLLITCSLFPVKKLFSQSVEEQAPQVNVTQGIMEGTHDSGLNIFRGIPFAQPPVDELRWREPQKAKAWDGSHTIMYLPGRL